MSSTLIDTCRVTTNVPRVAVTKKLLVTHLSPAPGVPRINPVFPVVPEVNHAGRFWNVHATGNAGSPPVAENAYRYALPFVAFGSGHAVFTADVHPFTENTKGSRGNAPVIVTLTLAVFCAPSPVQNDWMPPKRDPFARLVSFTAFMVRPLELAEMPMRRTRLARAARS